MMSNTIFHSIYTVLMLLVFVGIVVWAWSSKRRQPFDEAANLPFADEAQHQNHNNNEHQKEEAP